MTRHAARIVLAFAVVVLPACGGGGSSPSGPSTIPSGPQTTVIAQGGNTLAVGEVGALPFTTTATGRLDVTVNWTFASNDLDVARYRGNCSPAQIIALICLPFQGAVTLNKPEVFSAANSAAGTYTLAIENLGPANESLTYEVTLTR